jgi:hypothetical protein
VFHHLGQLSPGTIRVYAAAIEHRRSFGEPPSADVVRALAREEGASEGAALVLCRWEAISQHGRAISLAMQDPGWHVVVHDRETLVAIICTDRLPRARVFLADGRPLPNRMLRTYADGWDEAVAQGRTVTEVKS